MLWGVSQHGAGVWVAGGVKNAFHLLPSTAAAAGNVFGFSLPITSCRHELFLSPPHKGDRKIAPAAKSASVPGLGMGAIAAEGGLVGKPATAALQPDDAASAADAARCTGR